MKNTTNILNKTYGIKGYNNDITTCLNLVIKGFSSIYSKQIITRIVKNLNIITIKPQIYINSKGIENNIYNKNIFIIDINKYNNTQIVYLLIDHISENLFPKQPKYQNLNRIIRIINNEQIIKKIIKLHNLNYNEKIISTELKQYKYNNPLLENIITTFQPLITNKTFFHLLCKSIKNNNYYSLENNINKVLGNNSFNQLISLTNDFVNKFTLSHKSLKNYEEACEYISIIKKEYINKYILLSNH